MRKNKIIKHLGFSLALFTACLLFGYGVLGNINDYGTYHWLFLLPILLPVSGLYFSLKALMAADGLQWKSLAFLMILANVGLAAFVFLAFSLTYVQF